MNKILTRREEKINSIAEDLRQKNHDVIIQPSTQDLETLPFDLQQYNYVPSIIAFNHEGGCIVEVKLKSRPVSVERFLSITETIAQHSGWRFLIATLDDISEFDLLEALQDFPDWQTLVQRLLVARQLLDNDDFLEPAYLYVWNLIEIALRKRMLDVSLSLERWQPMKLIKNLYSLGELSEDEYDYLELSLPHRNKIVHGLMTSINHVDCHKLYEVSQSLFERWSESNVSAGHA